MNEFQLVALVFVLLAVSVPFELWGFMDDERKAGFLSRAYVRFPRWITRTRLFQSTHYKYLYMFSEIHFWSRCFANEQHHWVWTGNSIHCTQCHGHIMAYNLTGNHNFENAEDILKVMVAFEKEAYYG